MAAAIADVASRVVTPGAVLLDVSIRDKSVSPESVNVVLYHGSSCSDGFASAWAAWTRLGASATYHAMEHAPGVAPPAVTNEPDW